LPPEAESFWALELPMQGIAKFTPFSIFCSFHSSDNLLPGIHTCSPNTAQKLLQYPSLIYHVQLSREVNHRQTEGLSQLSHIILMKCDLSHAKSCFYRGANEILGKIGRFASVNVILELTQSKCIHALIIWSRSSSIE